MEHLTTLWVKKLNNFFIEEEEERQNSKNKNKTPLGPGSSMASLKYTAIAFIVRQWLKMLTILDNDWSTLFATKQTKYKQYKSKQQYNKKQAWQCSRLRIT